MLIAYVDESANRDRTFYYMGALLTDTRAIEAIDSGFDRLCSHIASRVAGFAPNTEIHAYEMFHGMGGWRAVPLRLRVQACVTAARIIGSSGARFVFRGVDVPALRSRYVRPFEPHALALAHALESVHRVVEGDRLDDRVLVMADEHHTAPESRTSFRAYRLEAVKGMVSGPLTSLVDTMYFGPSCDSRLLQAADLATFFENRSRNCRETDSRAVAAMRSISESLEEVRRFSYVWP